MHCPPCTPLRYRCDAKYWLQGAEADALRECAAAIVEYQNKERTEDVLRIAAFALGVPLERLEGAQLLWLDRLGIYLFAATIGGPGAQVIGVTCAARAARPCMQKEQLERTGRFAGLQCVEASVSIRIWAGFLECTTGLGSEHILLSCCACHLCSQ